MNEVFKIKKQEELENGANYQVTVELPFDTGWIDYIDLVVEKGNEILTFPLKHKKNENNKIIFEGNFYLETRAIYHYYFKYKVNNQIKYIKKENINDNTIIKDEMYKMSVNFNTPNWAKGKVMYHIFVDRFNRGSNIPLKPMPRRTIYNNWEDDMIIGPNQEGIWNADFYGGNLKE